MPRLGRRLCRVHIGRSRREVQSSHRTCAPRRRVQRLRRPLDTPFGCLPPSRQRRLGGDMPAATSSCGNLEHEVLILPESVAKVPAPTRASIAQLVEQRILNPRVLGSSPSGGTKRSPRPGRRPARGFVFFGPAVSGSRGCRGLRRGNWPPRGARAPGGAPPPSTPTRGRIRDRRAPPSPSAASARAAPAPSGCARRTRSRGPPPTRTRPSRRGPPRSP